MGVAEFLQDTLSQMAKDLKARSDRNKPQAVEEDEGGEGESKEGGSSKEETGGVTASSLVSFLEHVRSGEPVSTDEILLYAPLFRDDITLTKGHRKIQTAFIEKAQALAADVLVTNPVLIENKQSRGVWVILEGWVCTAEGFLMHPNNRLF